MKRPIVGGNSPVARDRDNTVGQKSEHVRTPLRRLLDNETSVNGGNTLIGADFAAIASYRRIVSAIVNDQRGVNGLSEVRRHLIYRFAAATVMAEKIEARLARGEKIDGAAYASISNTMTRIGQIIGLDRQTHTHKPRLADLLGLKESRGNQ